MPFNTFWIYEPRVTCGHFYGQISIEEIYEANAVAIERIRMGTPPVHVIVNTLEIEKIPTSLRAVQELIAYTREPNLGWIIYVSNNRLISFFNSVVSQLSTAKFLTVDTVEEALSTLQKLDSSLPELKLPDGNQ